jgi:predicted ester cyclase
MHGLEEYQAYIRWLHKTFGDLEISIEESIAAGDNVVVRWSQRCVHQAKFLGLPATGKPISWTGITIFRLHDVRVIEERGEEDLLGVMWQLGAIPRPGQKAT